MRGAEATHRRRRDATLRSAALRPVGRHRGHLRRAPDPAVALGWRQSSKTARVDRPTDDPAPVALDHVRGAQPPGARRARARVMQAVEKRR